MAWAQRIESRRGSGCFSGQRRPSDNPLIVHIAELSTLEVLIPAIPAEAKMLAEKFWGPLPWFEKLPQVPDVTTGFAHRGHPDAG